MNEILNMQLRPNVLYLTWGEVPVKDGIYENQVIGQLLEIKRQSPETALHLRAGIPIVNRYTTIERDVCGLEIEQINNQLADANIEFSFCWIWAVAKWFHSKRVHFPFFVWGQLAHLKRFIQQNNITIIHCRGYHAARLALLTKERFDLDISVIFDTRGLFPEEGLLAGYYRCDSASYAYWKTIEQWLFDQADTVVNVSETFSQYVRSKTSNPSIHTIFTSTELAVFQPANPDAKMGIRAELGIEAKERILIYVGSIGVDSGWHRLANLIELYKTFQHTLGSTKLLIVTRAAHQPIRDSLDAHGILKETILTSAASREETSRYLQAADYGALSYYTVNDDIEQLVGYTVIASKTGEYLATGLPMLVNRAAGAAAQFVDEHALGCTYDSGSEHLIEDGLLQIEKRYAQVSQSCVEQANIYFSAEQNAKRYLMLYKNESFNSTPS